MKGGNRVMVSRDALDRTLDNLIKSAERVFDDHQDVLYMMLRVGPFSRELDQWNCDGTRGVRYPLESSICKNNKREGIQIKTVYIRNVAHVKLKT